jgi:hypothetical protein
VCLRWLSVAHLITLCSFIGKSSALKDATGAYRKKRNVCSVCREKCFLSPLFLRLDSRLSEPGTLPRDTCGLDIGLRYFSHRDRDEGDAQSGLHLECVVADDPWLDGDVNVAVGNSTIDLVSRRFKVFLGDKHEVSVIGKLESC